MERGIGASEWRWGDPLYGLTVPVGKSQRYSRIFGRPTLCPIATVGGEAGGRPSLSVIDMPLETNRVLKGRTTLSPESCGISLENPRGYGVLFLSPALTITPSCLGQIRGPVNRHPGLYWKINTFQICKDVTV